MQTRTPDAYAVQLIQLSISNGVYVNGSETAEGNSGQGLLLVERVY